MWNKRWGFCSLLSELVSFSSHSDSEAWPCGLFEMRCRNWILEMSGHYRCFLKCL